jgi:hypothetical protein
MPPTRGNARIFHIISIQRRMADASFARATSWEQAKSAHERWVAEYNGQAHWAHRKRVDGRLSPLEVVEGATGVLRSPDVMRHIFRHRQTRRFDAHGYMRFRRWRLYGEAGLGRKDGVVWVYRETLTIEYANAPLAQYPITYQPDRKHLHTVGKPQLFESPYQSPQLSLWEVGAVEWFPVQRLPDYAPRAERVVAPATQLTLFDDTARQQA